MAENEDVPVVVRRRNLRDLPGLRQQAFERDRSAPLLPPDEPAVENDDEEDLPADPALREKLLQEYRRKS